MLKLATVSLVMLLSVSARAASPAPRVVILDALQLTPGLERINTRQRILEAVTAAVKEHGWEPVLGTTECHNLTCAGLLAANAKANYVLALLGAYDPPGKYTTFSANDVGVSLWRDGGMWSPVERRRTSKRTSIRPVAAPSPRADHRQVLAQRLS